MIKAKDLGTLRCRHACVDNDDVSRHVGSLGVDVHLVALHPGLPAAPSERQNSKGCFFVFKDENTFELTRV